jgi:hypothetical protein
MIANKIVPCLALAQSVFAGVCDFRYSGAYYTRELEKFTTWKRKEADHANLNSPPKTGRKHGELCDVE